MRNPELPDFMVFLNWPELPVYWYGFQHFAYAALMIVLVPGLLAFLFGWFAFRSRVTGVYLSIITQAMTFALMLGFFRNNFGFGGNNGLTDFKDILGFNVQAAGTRAALFAASCVALALGFVICRAIITSKFGKVLVAIRDAESRTRFLGYRVESYKLFVFTVSACMAGVAGALYVPQVGIINPSEFAPANSIEAVIWVAVGGRGTLIGPIVGAMLVNYAKTTFHHRHAGALLAVPAGRAVRRRYAAATARHRRHHSALLGGTPAARACLKAKRPCRRRRPRSRPMIAQTTTALLYLDGVSVSFDGFRALNQLSLAIEPGEMRAIIGPNGAGKTTMMDVVTGKTRPDAGDVYFDGGGFDLTKLDEARDRRARHRTEISEADCVRDAYGGGQSPARAALRPRRARKPVWRDTPAQAHRIDELLDLIRLRPVHDRLAGGLSHGQKQWLEIGMLLAQEPKLLLVDEPVAGMTDAETRQTAELLKEINLDRTVVVVEHDMAFVRDLGVKVTVLHEGGVIAEGTIDDVSANERVVEVYLGR